MPNKHKFSVKSLSRAPRAQFLFSFYEGGSNKYKKVSNKSKSLANAYHEFAHWQYWTCHVQLVGMIKYPPHGAVMT